MAGSFGLRDVRGGVWTEEVLEPPPNLPVMAVYSYCQRHVGALLARA